MLVLTGQPRAYKPFRARRAGAATFSMASSLQRTVQVGQWRKRNNLTYSVRAKGPVKGDADRAHNCHLRPAVSGESFFGAWVSRRTGGGARSESAHCSSSALLHR